MIRVRQPSGKQKEKPKATILARCRHCSPLIVFARTGIMKGEQEQELEQEPVCELKHFPLAVIWDRDGFKLQRSLF